MVSRSVYTQKFHYHPQESPIHRANTAISICSFDWLFLHVISMVTAWLIESSTYHLRILYIIASPLWDIFCYREFVYAF